VSRIGLVGCGRWGSLVRRDLEDLGASVVVVDPAVEGAIGDVDELPEVDGVVVATPATTHAELVGRLLDRDVPVFCEKPFTTDVDEARALVERGGDRIHLMHVWRYHRGVERLGELARDGSLGRVLGVRTTRVGGPSPRVDTDAVWTLVPHDLTIALEVLGHVPTPRAAVADVVDGRALGLWGLCGDEQWLVVEASTRHSTKRREVRVHGDRAVAVLDADDAPAVRVERDGGVEDHPIAPDPSLRRELAAFLAHLGGGPPPKSDAAEGLLVVEAVQALRDRAGL